MRLRRLRRMPATSPAHPATAPGNARRTTEARCAAILERGAMPICLGGDDSVPIPILRAFDGRGPLTILQVDAHLDFRDEVDGVREGYSSPMRRASEMSHVERDRSRSGCAASASRARVGRRGCPRRRQPARHRARASRARRRRGCSRSCPADASVFVSFDCDGLDPSVLPAVSAPAPGGLTYPEAWDLLCAASGPAWRGRPSPSMCRTAT